MAGDRVKAEQSIKEFDESLLILDLLDGCHIHRLPRRPKESNSLQSGQFIIPVIVFDEDGQMRDLAPHRSNVSD